MGIFYSKVKNESDDITDIVIAEDSCCKEDCQYCCVPEYPKNVLAAFYSDEHKYVYNKIYRQTMDARVATTAKQLDLHSQKVFEEISEKYNIQTKNSVKQNIICVNLLPTLKPCHFLELVELYPGPLFLMSLQNLGGVERNLN